MQILIDTHVHLYDFYRLDIAFDAAIKNMEAASSSASSIKCIFLTERFDCDCFEMLSRGEGIPDGFSLGKCSEDGVLRVSRNGADDGFFLFAGRQIVTRERIEVLAILCPSRIEDGAELRETIEAVQLAGGIPVLCWAPGKWNGKRGRLVRYLARAPGLDPLMLGDSTHRLRGLGEPVIFAEGRKLKRRILAGSDPLPFGGEEKMIGSYGVIIEGAFDPDCPLSSIKSLLLSDCQIKFFGRRCGVIKGGVRLLQNELRRRLRK